MNLFFSATAKKQLEDLPPELKPLFFKHFEKILQMPPRRHMKYGIPCHVEDVTRQARIIYETEGDHLYVLQCFKNHKEYERWYKAYK